MKRIISLCIVAAMALGLTSCFEYKGVVTVNKDGSATLEEVALISEQMKTILSSAPGGDDPDVYGSGLILDKAKAEKRAKNLGEGVTLKSHEEITLPDRKSGVKMIYTIADINKLKFHAGEMKNPSDQSKYTTFAYDGKNLTISNPEKTSDLPSVPESEEEKKVKRAQMLAMKSLFTGAHFAMEVKVPGGIASTDATYATGDTITMVDVDFDKLLKNDDHFFGLLDSFGSISATQIGLKFKGVDGVRLESKEVIKAAVK